MATSWKALPALWSSSTRPSGAQKGIKVSTESQGSVNDLETSVMDSAEGKVGAAAMPNIFSAYADTAYALDRMGMVVDLAPYLTEEEKAQFVEGYLSEGGFGEDDSIKIFPVAKPPNCCSSMTPTGRLLPDATDVRYEDLATMEGLTAAAEKYYNWTDAQTAAPDDGKRCSAVMPWQTICWWAHSSWATPSLQ